MTTEHNTENEQLDHLFRREYRRLVSVLSTKFNSTYIENIEDAVQEALMKATQVWGFSGIPENPSGWLYRVAHNALIDQLRKINREVKIETPHQNRTDAESDSEMIDEQLQMIFACCHPALKQEDQLILSLKILGGMSLNEIASALLKKEEAVKKQYQRARQKFKEKVGELKLPDDGQLPNRMASVLRVIYLLFNEGYKTSSGKEVINRELSEEALVLTLMLQRNHRFNSPEVNALIALMCFNMARFESRIGADGELIPLPEQDRKQWDRDLIQLGYHYLKNAQAENNISTYLLEAMIAATHTSAPSYEETNWDTIVKLYAKLSELTHSPMVALNQAIALKEQGKLQDATNLFEKTKNEKEVRDHYLTYCIEADLLVEKNRLEEAKQQLKKAIDRTSNLAEKSFLQLKIKRI